MKQFKPHFNAELAVNFKQRKRKEKRKKLKSDDKQFKSIDKTTKRKFRRQNLAVSQGSDQMSASEDETCQSADLEAQRIVLY